MELTQPKGPTQYSDAEDPLQDNRALYRAAPAYVPVDNGFELEWRGGRMHIRVAITKDRNYVWIDTKSSGEFEAGPLEEKTQSLLRALSTLNTSLPPAPDRKLSGDFYEEDEPLVDVLAAFDRGEKSVTAPPAS
jgi:hypothetical protein